MDHNVYTFYIFITHYESIITYLINLLPNILSYAFFITDWIARIKELLADEDWVELAYVIAVIVRKLLIFEYSPDSLRQ